MLGIRLDAETERSLAAAARRHRQTKSDIARQAIRDWLTRRDAVTRAAAEWKAISDVERHDRDMDDALDFGLSNLDVE